MDCEREVGKNEVAGRGGLEECCSIFSSCGGGFAILTLYDKSYKSNWLLSAQPIMQMVLD